MKCVSLGINLFYEELGKYFKKKKKCIQIMEMNCSVSIVFFFLNKKNLFFFLCLVFIIREIPSDGN